MKVVFFASGISPHIAPVCDELYKRYGEEFRFFGTDIKPIKAMKIMGAENLHQEKKYFYNVNDSAEIMNMSMEWARNADVAIVGCSNCYHYMDVRFEQGNKLTFKLRERLFKSGFYDKDDQKLQYKIQQQIKKHVDKNLFFLCAGLYVPYDFITVGVPEEKVIKWGYFPKESRYDYNELNRNYDGVIHLIWVGRFVQEKLPHNAILGTQKLLELGYDVHLSMIGYGEEEEHLKKYVEECNLAEHISFLGAMNENQIREKLRNSHIFLMTSNYEEGWGVVVNEAMSEGCVPVVSYSTGATDMLVEEVCCGQLYFHNDCEDLVFQTRSLLDNKKMLCDMSRNAYNQIVSRWNAKIATDRLIEFIDKFRADCQMTMYETGPLGKIHIFENEQDVNMLIRKRRGLSRDEEYNSGN